MDDGITTKSRGWLTVCALIALWVSGCGASEINSGDAAVDSGAPLPVVDSGVPDTVADASVGDGGTDASFDADAAAACSVLPNGGSVIQPTVLAQSLPSGAGGAITTGTYYLTSVTYFFGLDAGTAPSETWRQAISLNGSVFETVSVRNATSEQRSSGGFATNGSQVTFAESCPAPAVRGPFEYTATDSELIVYVSSDRRKFVYTKQ